MDNGSRVSFEVPDAMSKTSAIAPKGDILDVARWLARYNQASDPGIIASYLFPSDAEIRLVHLDTNSPASERGETIAPFYFGSDRTGRVPYPSAIALIRPEEKEYLPLPEGWGEWSQATQIVREKE